MSSQIALRAHQAEAVDGILRHLSNPSGGIMPPEGLRTQVIAATGSGKTVIGVEAARRLSAHRVLVLVPTLDLLMQMAQAWRRAGRHGAMVGVCSLRPEESQGIPCTTDPAALAAMVGELETVTVYATYAAVGMGVLQRAHEAGMPVWDLMIVDEAHRTSGDAGKPWGAVHEQSTHPAVRRLYMTATARVWEAEGDSLRLVASMEPDSPIFGPVAYRLPLSEAIERGIVAPYQVLCLDIRDRELYEALASEAPGSAAVRGARLAAIQAGLMRAAREERFRRVLSFHSKIVEAEAMAAGLPTVAARLAEDAPGDYPPVERVWADWLYGEHPPVYRRRVLDEFASDFLSRTDEEGKSIPAALQVLSSVKVLGEGVDTAECDSALFADARGSMVDIVQMVGRALRMHPNSGKIATLIVPVFLGEDEDPDEMITSDAYGTLAKILTALRSHDAEMIESLAEPRERSTRADAELDREDGELEGEGEGQEDGAQAGGSVGAAAAGVLRFAEERDPASLAAFIRLRVIDPEGAYWRRGIEAATRWRREHPEETTLAVPYAYITPDGWGPLGGFSLGQWVARVRHTYGEGLLDTPRIVEAERLGMVWSAQDAAWEEGRGVAEDYAAVHGHCLPPTSAVWRDYPIGVWVKNQRAAARRTRQNAERRAAGETGVPSAGELSAGRMDAMDAIDPGWCPAWDIAWQRCFTLVRAHVTGGGELPTAAGAVIVQGEDLGAWVTAQAAGFGRLLPAQQWLLTTLGVEPAPEPQTAPAPAAPRRSQADRRALGLAAARQYAAREGHLTVPRKHIEVVDGVDGVDGEEVKLGGWLDNTRRRADKLTHAERAELTALGMRW
ncbi:Helicase associated domain protein [Streptomyces spectabilis]|uniref:DEAD/DEAH box helicase n=1 Tax=Streptomyces spectabilis TaxID=68270 RepID=UPI0033E11B1F